MFVAHDLFSISKKVLHTCFDKVKKDTYKQPHHTQTMWTIGSLPGL